MRINKLTKTYDGRTVLNIEDFTFEKGRIYAVVGANGSGKSTFASIMAEAEKADEPGCIDINGFTVRYSPQKAYAFRMSVIKNITIAGKGRKDRAKALSLLESLDMKQLAQSSAHRLSGGETAKMALARVMMEGCDMLILDEPCAAMDMQSTLKSEELIKKYRDETGCCVVMITHSLKQAERTAEELLFLRNGELVEYGDCKKVLHSPEKEETKEFLEFFSL